jgi:hypothetical protein
VAGEQPPDAAESARSDEARDRAAGASQRREELARRSRALAERLTRLRAGEPTRLEDAMLAVEAEKAELWFAAIARDRAAEAMRLSAAAHDRAAAAHERAAAAHAGDEADHRAQAARHRRLAAEDRAAGDVEGQK